MLEILDRLPAEAAGLLAVIAGLSVLAAWLALQDRRRRGQDAARHALAMPAPQPIRNWNEARAARDVVRAGEIADMQAAAARQIDAVEHSLNRLLAQCGPLIGRPSVRPVEPLRQPAEAAAAEIPRRPLAA